MAVSVDGLIAIPDLPAAAALKDTDLFITNQNAVDGKISLLALTSYFMDKAHPKGAIFMSNLKGLNPNTQFPGQTWVRVAGNGRSLRICATDESDLGATGGADTVTIGAGNLPNHTHTFSGTTAVGGGHTPAGSIAANGAHTHTVSGSAASAGAHTHSVSGTAANAGNHHHLIDLDAQGMNSNGSGGYGKIATGDENPEGSFKNFNTNDAGTHSHSVSGTAASAGAHTHTISGTAASAGSHAHTFTGSAVAAHSHTFSGTTSSAGGTGSPAALDVAGLWVKIAAWHRTA